MAIFDLFREEHVYPVIRAVGLRGETLVAVEEHHVIRLVLRDLMDMSCREEVWAAKLGALAELVERHFRREERDVFPVAQERIGRSRQRELEDQYRRFASSPVPAGGESADARAALLSVGLAHDFTGLL